MDMVLASEASTSLTIYKLFLLIVDDTVQTEVDIPTLHWLKGELEDIKSLLEDAYEKSEEDEGDLSDSVKVWLKHTKEVAELVDDFVDESLLRRSQAPSIRRGLTALIGSLDRIVGMSVPAKIRKIEALFRAIKERGEGLVRSKTAGVKWYQPCFGPPVDEEYVTVGTDSVANELIQRLMEGESRRSVISLVGAGGIGKTTLAKKVYDDEKIRGYFDFCSWITVSKRYDIEDLQKKMAKTISDVEGIETVSLRECLRSKRYMLVFDEVWDKEFWQFMKDALPDNDRGSRIIITTRSFTVARSCKESSFDHVQRVEPLSEAMSWDLFCRIAFQYETEQLCPPELKQLSLELIRMCEGLPLGIVAVAVFLSTKSNIASEWQRVVDNFYFLVKSDPQLSIIYKILALSFRDLPYQLKLCFLYFSIFPVGSLIPYDRLVRLWIAEGFIRLKTGKTLEEVAEEYLNELIHRNLVQAFEGFYGLEKFCRVHSLMHVIAQQMADVFSFRLFRKDKNSSIGQSRRLLINNEIDDNVFGSMRDSRVRSVFLSNVGSLSYGFMITLFEKNKLLTLLDFENVALDRLPEEVGNLFHLKYLSLKNTKLKRLPKSLGKLHNLQTLDVRNTQLAELPIEINMLGNLRHLLASHCHNKFGLGSTQGVRIKEGIRFLSKLQTLMTVEAHFNIIGLFEELQELTIRRLCISGLTTEVASALCSCIKEMGNLESLTLHSMNDYEILDVQNIPSAPPLLQHVTLKGRLQRLPNWISSLQSLSMLCLCLSRLTDDPLRNISILPNLVSLWLYRAYEGDQFHFEVGGFQKLKFLVLRDLRGLEVVKIEEGALPLLEELRIGPSPLLNEVPSGIQHLRNLKVLAFYDMPNEFVLLMQPNGGSDYWKVERVPSVLFGFRVQGRSYALYELGQSELLDRLQGSATNINDAIQHNLRLSFCYSDDEAESAASTSAVPWNDMRLSISRDQMSFSSDRFSFFSDDIED